MRLCCIISYVFAGLLLAIRAHSQSTFQYDNNGNLTNVTSAVITASPIITEPPQTQNVIPGVDVSFAVFATGPEPMTYQWYDNALPIVGATNSELFISSVTTTNQGSYTVTVCNSYGCVSNSVPALLQFTVTWVAKGTGDWYNPQSWFPALIPTGFNNIIIPAGSSVNLSGPVTVTGNLTWSGGTMSGSSLNIASNALVNISGATSVSNQWSDFGTIELAQGSLQVNEPMSIMANGVLTISGNATVGFSAALVDAGTLALTQGTLEVSNLFTIMNSGVLSISGNSTFGIFGVMTNAGTIGLTQGTLRLYKAMTIATNGIVNITGTNNISLFGVLTNAGVVNWAGLGNLEVYANQLGENYYGGIVNLAGASFNVQNDQNIQANTANGYIAYFSNAGTFLKSAGTNTTINVNFTNTGIVDLESGMLNLNSNSTANSGSVFTGSGTNMLGGSGALTMNGSVTISNLSLAVATLGGNGVVSGSFAWTGGSLGNGNAGYEIPFSSLTVAANGVMNIIGSNSLSLNGILTNAGIVNWSGTGNLVINANEQGISQDGGIVNLPGAVFNVQNDQTVQASDVNGYIAYFNNAGTFLKSAGTNTTINVNFTNTGMVNVESGMLTLNSNSVGSSGCVFTSSGTNVLGGSGTLTLNGNVTISNLSVAVGTLAGNSIVSGSFAWTGGSLGIGNAGNGIPFSSLTVASNSVMNINGGNSLNLNGILTNAGTVNWTGTGNLDVNANQQGISFDGGIVNLAGALFSVQNNQILQASDANGYIAYFNNAGTFLKSAGTNTTINVNFTNTGIVNVESGVLTVNSNLAGSSGCVFTGAGTNVLGGPGTLTLNGNVTISNLSVAVGTLAGNSVVSGSFAWTGGSLGIGNAGNGIPFSSLTVASNAVMNINGGNSLNLNGILTNAGTVNWTGTGNLDVNANEAGISFDGGIVNLLGALFNVQNNQTIQASDVNGYIAYFNNAGTFLKSAGTNTTININFTNTGIVNVDSGVLTVNSNLVGGSGCVFIGAGTNVLGGSGILTLNGNVIITNLSVTVGTLAGNSVVSGSFAWTGGSLGYGNAGNGIPFCSLTVATNGVMNISGGNSLNLNGVLTNAGLVNWSGTGNLEINANQKGISQDGGIVNLAGAAFNVLNDQIIQANNVNGYIAYFNNAGTFLKSAGTNTTINVNFTNNIGMLNAQTGMISLIKTYTLTGGSLNVGISGATNYGVIHFAGSTPLNGLGFTANLENGFVPAGSNSFAVVTYGSRSGIFTSASLPSSMLWQTNYGSTAFTLTALGVNPVLVPSTITSGTSNQFTEFMLQFIGSTNLSYLVLATTNLALPLSNWSNLGNPNLISNTVFQFIDSESTNIPSRFYILQSP